MGMAVETKLNKARIENMTGQEALYRVPDGEVRGLVLQVTPAGIKSWVLRFYVNGRRVSHTLGRWPELTVTQARKLAVDLQSKISQGEDPAATRRAEREAETVAELAERFKKEHLPTLKASTRKEYLRLLDNVILPGLGSRRVKDVQPSDVAAFLSKIRSSTSVPQNPKNPLGQAWTNHARLSDCRCERVSITPRPRRHFAVNA